MKNLICLVLLLMSGSSFALPSGSQNALQLGGIVNSDNLVIPEANSQGYFTLYTNDGTKTGTHYGAFYKNGVAYQVTAGKTFQVTKICIATVAANTTFQLMSATASFAENAASVTGGVYQSGVAAGNSLQSTAANTYVCYGSTYSFAASTYPGFGAGGTTNYYLAVTGKEI
jgi:hypothetical protein